MLTKLTRRLKSTLRQTVNVMTEIQIVKSYIFTLCILRQLQSRDLSLKTHSPVKYITLLTDVHSTSNSRDSYTHMFGQMLVFFL